MNEALRKFVREIHARGLRAHVARRTKGRPAWVYDSHAWVEFRGARGLRVWIWPWEAAMCRHVEETAALCGLVPTAASFLRSSRGNRRASSGGTPAKAARKREPAR